MTFIRHDLGVRVPWQPPGLSVRGPISLARSTTPAGSGGCFHFPGPAGLQSSIPTQLQPQQRLWNFGGGGGGGEEVCSFDACFLFSMSDVMKRQMSCGRE